jgi:AcrR family transcriptional regulator
VHDVQEATQRPLRVDAARNAELLVRTAWQAFTEAGTGVPLDEIAKRAGVGVATLYRRFPTKDDLLLAVLEWRYVEEVEPVLEKALVDDDPWRAMVTTLEAAMAVIVSAMGVVKAVRDPATLLSGLKTRYVEDLTEIMRKAQKAGGIRADLTVDDLRIVLFMLISCVRMDTLPATGWRRGLGVLLDGLRASSATELPPPSSPSC